MGTLHTIFSILVLILEMYMVPFYIDTFYFTLCVSCGTFGTYFMNDSHRYFCNKLTPFISVHIIFQIPRVGRPRKVTRRGEVRLLRTVKKNRGKVLREITNDFNEGGVVRVHPKTIQRYLHNNNIFRRVVRKKMVVREVNKKKRLSWCLERRRWTFNLHWNQVIFSDESQIVIGQNNRVYVWRSSNEAYRPECTDVSAISEEGVCYDLGVHYMVWCGNFM